MDLVPLKENPIEFAVKEERGFIGSSSTLANPDDPLLEALGVNRSLSGESVTAKKILGLSAFWAGQRAISEDLANMTKEIVKVNVDSGTSEIQFNHPAFELLNNKPNPEMNAFDFINTLYHHALVWGDGYAEIVRNKAGVPQEIYLLDPTTVQVERTREGNIQYVVRAYTDDQTFVGIELRQEDVLHLKGPSYNGFKGYEIASVLKDSLGAALANQSFSNSFFNNNIIPSGVLEVPDVLSDNAFAHLRDSFSERHAGRANNYKPILLEEGTKWTQISVDPEKAQMIEAMQFAIEDVARILRIPLSKLQHLLKAANHNSLESLNKEYEEDSLRPWGGRFAAECKMKLLQLPQDKLVILQFAWQERTSANINDRTASYRETFNIGAATPDEIRKAEGGNPYPEGIGQHPWINSTMIPMSSSILIADEKLRQIQLENEKLELEIEKMKEKPEEQDENNLFDDPGMAEEEDEPEEDGSETDEEADPSEEEDSSGNEEEERKLDEIQDIHQPLMEEIYKRILHLEQDKATRAIKKDQLSGHIERFYGPSHEEEVHKRLAPVVDSFVRSSLVCLDTGLNYGDLAPKVDIFLKKQAKRHIFTSKYDLKEGSAAYWMDTRYVDTADNTLSELRELVKNV